MSSEPLTVTVVINGLGTGGAERSLADTIPVLQSSGIALRVVCLHRRDEGVHDIVEGLGVPVSILTSSSFLGRVNELTSLLRSHPPSVVHTAIFEANMVGRLAARRARLPVLTSLVNTPYDESRRSDPRVARWKLGSLQQLDGLAARHITSHFHAITEAVKAAAVETLRVNPNDLTVIPRGRDSERLGRRSEERRARVRESLGEDGSTRIILAVGRQEFQKGHVYLLDALAPVRARDGNVRLWIAGREGAMSKEIRSRTTHLGLSDSVRMLGHRDDVPDLMAAADVLTFPSLYEGLGGTLIEAMALELPIVASDLPAIREVTDSGRCALLVEPRRPAALADAVVEGLSHQASTHEKVSLGRRRFEELYTAERVGSEMAQLLRKVAALG